MWYFYVRTTWNQNIQVLFVYLKLIIYTKKKKKNHSYPNERYIIILKKIWKTISFSMIILIMLKKDVKFLMVQYGEGNLGNISTIKTFANSYLLGYLVLILLIIL